MLEQKMASLDVSEEEQHELLEDLQRKETEYTRLMRNRLCVDDFDLLSIIGRGAFGEVSLFLGLCIYDFTNFVIRGHF